MNDDQPTSSFPSLPYPSGQDGSPGGQASDTPAQGPPKGWRARRKARRAATGGAGGAPPGPPTPPSADGELPGPPPLDVPEPLASSMRGLRRQRKRLLHRRDEMLFHLGGLAYDLHLLGELESPVIERRAGMIHALDTTVDAIDAQLTARGKPGGGQRLPIVVGSCRTCRSLFVADARYCMSCGRILAPPDPSEVSE